MIKNISALEVKTGEKVYRFLCDVDSPVGEVHDALTKMKSYVVDIINQANQPPPSAVEPIIEER